MMDRKEISVSVSSLTKSHKSEGKFEKEIVPKVARFFSDKGYDVKEHVSLNVAWGQALYEVDVVAIKDEEITLVEVKSKRDKISRAYDQIERLRSIIDYCFVASDASIRDSHFDGDIGILLVNNEVKIMRNARRVNVPITKGFLVKLKKKCLDRLYNRNGLQKRVKKESLAGLILGKADADKLRREVRKTVFCSQKCDECPL